MTFLDILLLGAWWTAGVFSFLTGRDSLHKLFFGLIIGFLMYALVSTQVELVERLSPSEMNSYQNFLSKSSTWILSMLLIFVPIIGMFFMLTSRIAILTEPRKFSHILLWLLLPIYLVGILSFLWDGSILTENPTWSRIFSFFETSKIYQIFQTLPWAIFAFLGLIAFYKVFFTIAINFCIWFYQDIVKEFFRSWRERREQKQQEQEYEEEA